MTGVIYITLKVRLNSDINEDEVEHYASQLCLTVDDPKQNVESYELVKATDFDNA